MAKKIKVDPAQLETVAGKIEAQSAEYENLYNQIYSEVNNLNNAWKGIDNQTYKDRIEDFKDDLASMKRVMDEFAKFLKTSAKAYKDTQGAIVQAAGKLAN